MCADSSRPVLALEISALADKTYTGISNVAKFLARQMLADVAVEPCFFLGRNMIPVDIVGRLTNLDGGDVLWWLADRLNGRTALELSHGRKYIGLYPGQKRHRRIFPTEVQIVHDLTAVVTPQFHTRRTIQIWNETASGDVLSSDLIVTVSESTKIDLLTYIPAIRTVPCVVVPIAPTTLNYHISRAENAEPFIFVLGTLEPRKNVELILKALAAFPLLLQRCKFLFAGAQGWGDDLSDLIARYGLSDMLQSGRIVPVGYVSSAARDVLLAAALAVIYPSRYEGFGLPVVEALSFGTPVLTSFSSSLPEIGGDLPHFCDIDSVESLYAGIMKILSPSMQSKRGNHREEMTEYSWETTYHLIKQAALEVARGKKGLA